MAMDKAACARKVYTAMVQDILNSRDGDEDFASLSDMTQIEVAGVIITRNSLFPVSDDFFHVLAVDGITAETLKQFGFLGDVIDSPAINVRAVIAAGGNTPSASDPNPAPL